jgi:hypothetical protein
MNKTIFTQYISYFTAHSLNIETGRYYNIDRHARICNMRNNNDIEDEHHSILECSKYVDIRRKYLGDSSKKETASLKNVSIAH